MIKQKGTSPSSSALPPIWGQLGSNRQKQVIGLMAHLAFNLLIAHYDGRKKEEKDVKPIERTQSTT